MQIINIIALILGPVAAVIITLFYQSHKEKKEIQKAVFLSLLTHRKSNPPAQELVDALNVIDAVYCDYPDVLRFWKEYYELLHPDYNNDLERRQHKYLELLHSIASVLGYKNLKQTDLDKFYSPKYHIDQHERYGKLIDEMIRVFENTGHILMHREDNK